MIVLTDDGQLTHLWPFVRDRFEEHMKGYDLRYVDARAEPLGSLDLQGVQGLAWFGGELTEELWTRAPDLKVVGAVTDGYPVPGIRALWDRGVHVSDATRAWAPSVAECGMALILCSLRRVCWWHDQVARGEPWRYTFGQFADDGRFVNGELGTKTVGVVGLGAIGGLLARWCRAFGATVLAHDPYAPQERFDDTGAIRAERAEVIEGAEILVVAVPPTPSAIGSINAELVDRIRRGAIVVTITRAAAIDTDALRRRVLADELFWAADVYDIEPLPPDDPILGRPNVVHLPHIAGRTRDVNIRVADLLAGDIQLVLEGRQPMCALTPDSIEIRTGFRP